MDLQTQILALIAVSEVTRVQDAGELLNDAALSALAPGVAETARAAMRLVEMARAVEVENG